MLEKQVKYSVFWILPTVAGALALFLPWSAGMRGFLALIWLAASGYRLGRRLLPDERRGWQGLLGTVVFAALTITLGAVVYRLYGLDLPATLFTLLASGWLSETIGARHATARQPFGLRAGESLGPDRWEDDSPAWRRAIRVAIGWMLALTALYLLIQGAGLLAAHGVDGSIRSPWDAAPRDIFVLFALAIGATLIVAHGSLSAGAALVAAAGATVFAASIAALTYKIGFGFDPFLHRATEQMIFADGAVFPKPFYYLGQYAAVTIIARFLGGHVSTIDHALVPVTLALVIPAAYYALRRSFTWPSGQSAAGAVAVLALPLASFASTTPQGFANALFLITACLALPASLGRFPVLPLVVLALASAVTHPLAGVPLLLFVAIIAASRGHLAFGPARFRQVLPYLLAAVGVLALPAIFLLNSLLTGADITLGTAAGSDSIIETLRGTNSVPTRRYDLLLDFVYGWKSVRTAAIIAAAAIGLALLRRASGAWKAWLLGALVCCGNFVLLKTMVQFPFLIAYERSSYADRLFELGLFLMAPLMCAAAAWAFARAAHGRLLLRAFGVALAAAVITSSLYLAYPRRDQYEASRGWSTSAADIEAVQSIAADAGDATYVVLTNQSVAAAAVHEFGFRRYFDSQDPTAPGPVFFYPIPTGGPLYSLFLDMNDARGARHAALAAMDLAGVDLAYYAVSYYWWDAQRITVEAQNEADRFWAIGSDVYIFRYER